MREDARFLTYILYAVSPFCQDHRPITAMELDRNIRRTIDLDHSKSLSRILSCALMDTWYKRKRRDDRGALRLGVVPENRSFKEGRKDMEGRKWKEERTCIARLTGRWQFGSLRARPQRFRVKRATTPQLACCLHQVSPWPLRVLIWSILP
jgi:hypothetical protein